VDDDQGTRDTFGSALKAAHYGVVVAASGGEALAAASGRRVDLLLVDLRLPDMLGTDVARTINQTAVVPFVLISGYLTTDVTVDAMRSGAANVIEKPVEVGDLCNLVAALLTSAAEERHETTALPCPQTPSTLNRPACVAARWAGYVLEACDSAEDLTTIDAWARNVGVSRSTLCACCEILDIQPRDARDLMRLLRALMQGRLRGAPPTSMLLVSDARTVKALLRRAGIPPGSGAWTPSIEQFLDSQHFVPDVNPGLCALRALMTTRVHPQ
jgi:DNA-binding response OmpR family regulator